MRNLKPLTITLATASLASMLVLSGCTKEEASTDEGTAQTDNAAVVMPAANETVLEFDVQGMTCDGCSSRVQSLIAALDGVSHCDVSLDDKKATVHVTNPELGTAIVDAVSPSFDIAMAGDHAGHDHDGEGHGDDHDDHEGHDHDHDENGHG